MEFTKEIWNKVLTGLNASTDLIKKYWGIIDSAYSEKGRCYHNMQHINQMLNASIKYEARLKDVIIVQLAIIYHDVVYSATKSDNEEKSAEMATSHLQQFNFTEKQVNKCSAYILATKGHEIDSNDQDLNYFLDFDLEKLGAPWEEYKEYTRQIRQEYKIYPKPIYNKGRKKVLRHLLELNRIFKTDEYYNLYEIQARKNIQQEILII